ncbi:MAG: beta-ketoacyl-ACP synthase II [Methylocystis sp.]
MRRVVVTGLGVVSPLGCGVETNWRRLAAGECGFKRIDTFEVSDLACQIAAVVPRGDGKDGTFNPDDWFDPKEQRKVDDFIIYGACAATQALKDAGWVADTPEKQETTGVLIGSGIGGLGGIYETSVTLREKGPRRVSPFFVSGRIINLAGGYVSIMHGLKGPNSAVVTACATGTHAIGDAGRIIAMGDADVMVAGGAESPVNRIGVAGFAACRALSTGFNDRPEAASRPYDRDRDGFVPCEGAGCVVLEEYEHAKARGAKSTPNSIGYGMSGDAYHITRRRPTATAPLSLHEGGAKRAGVSVNDIDYVNAHGTSTPLGDEIELKAVERLLNVEPKLAMSSTKSAIGHLLGAAGAVEAIYSILAMQANVAPPTRNLDNPSVETAIDLVPHKAREKEINIALSNSFGFGGTNASVLFRRAS